MSSSAEVIPQEVVPDDTPDILRQFLFEVPDCKNNVSLCTWSSVLRMQELFAASPDVQRSVIRDSSGANIVREQLCGLLSMLRTLTPTQDHSFRLAMEEALKNGIRRRNRHGNPHQPEQTQEAHIRYVLASS